MADEQKKQDEKKQGVGKGEVTVRPLIRVHYNNKLWTPEELLNVSKKTATEWVEKGYVEIIPSVD